MIRDTLADARDEIAFYLRNEPQVSAEDRAALEALCTQMRQLQYRFDPEETPDE
jgi:hypothetical protein